MSLNVLSLSCGVVVVIGRGTHGVPASDHRVSREQVEVCLLPPDAESLTPQFRIKALGRNPVYVVDLSPAPNVASPLTCASSCPSPVPSSVSSSTTPPDDFSSLPPPAGGDSVVEPVFTETSPAPSLPPTLSSPFLSSTASPSAILSSSASSPVALELKAPNVVYWPVSHQQKAFYLIRLANKDLLYGFTLVSIVALCKPIYLGRQSLVTSTLSTPRSSSFRSSSWSSRSSRSSSASRSHSFDYSRTPSSSRSHSQGPPREPGTATIRIRPAPPTGVPSPFVSPSSSFSTSPTSSPSASSAVSSTSSLAALAATAKTSLSRPFLRETHILPLRAKNLQTSADQVHKGRDSPTLQPIPSSPIKKGTSEEKISRASSPPKVHSSLFPTSSSKAHTSSPTNPQAKVTSVVAASTASGSHSPPKTSLMTLMLSMAETKKVPLSLPLTTKPTTTTPPASAHTSAKPTLPQPP